VPINGLILQNTFSKDRRTHHRQTGAQDVCLVCLEKHVELFSFVSPFYILEAEQHILTHFSAAARLLSALVQRRGNFFLNFKNKLVLKG